MVTSHGIGGRSLRPKRHSKLDESFAIVFAASITTSFSDNSLSTSAKSPVSNISKSTEGLLIHNVRQLIKFFESAVGTQVAVVIAVLEDSLRG